MTTGTVNSAVKKLRDQLMEDVGKAPDKAGSFILLYLDAAFQLGKQAVLREVALAASEIEKKGEKS